MNLCRRLLAVTSLFIAAATYADNATRSKPTLSAVEMTFISAQPGFDRALKQYIELNWFAMDSKAVKQGLMTSFELLENADKQGDWQYVVMVTYPQSQGYQGIVDEFEAIRSNHEETKVNGKSFNGLGKVVNAIKVLRASD